MADIWEDFVAKEKTLDLAEFDLLKDTAIIRKVGGEWCVMSESGKKLGCYKSRKEAEKRLKQIEYFKHRGDTEMAGWECYCRSCGSYFYSHRKRCDQSVCPNCNEQDDIIEITGEF